MNSATLIHYYNRLNGNSISLPRLKEFHERVQKQLDADSHGTYAKDLKGIHERVSKAIKKMIAEKKEMVERLNVELVDLESKPVNEKVNVKKKAASHKLPATGLDGIEYGLETSNPDGVKSGLGFTPDGQQKIYDMVTEMILDTMKQGGLFWREPWEGGGKAATKVKVNVMGPLPVNFVSKAPYSGINYWLLKYVAPHRKRYTVLNYLTITQVNELGGKVKKGAKAWPVIYYSLMYKYNGKNITEDDYERLSEDEQKKAQKIPFLQYYRVFNAHDVEGVPGIMEQVQARKTVLQYDVEPIKAAEAIVNGMPNRPDIQQSKQRKAAYYPGADYVHMPYIGVFDKEQEYYSTFFHELVHSTGHPSRLDRELSQEKKKYAFEELIAEMGASYLCAESGILYFTLKNSAAYLKGWSKRLKEEMEADSKFFLKAAAKSQKASDFITDRLEAKKKVEPKASKEKKAKQKSIHTKILPAPSMTPELKKSIHDLWHISRTALANSNSVPSRSERMSYVKKELLMAHPELADTSPKKLWFAIEDETAPFKQVAGLGQKLSKKAKSKKDKAPATRNPQPASLSGVNYDYKEVDLGPYKKDFHRLFSDTIVQVHGMPGHGKTVWLLKYAQYRAEQGETVLYVAREEYGRSVFDMKLKEHNINHQNIRFRRELEPEDLKWATVIILDSVSALKLNHEDVEELSIKYPNRNWHVVLQSTKDGNFRGTQEWEHLVDVAGEVRNRKMILSKNRLDPNNSTKAEKLRTADAIAENKKKQQIRQAVKESIQPPAQTKAA